MRTRDMAMACGTMFSILAVGTALAQQEQPRPSGTPATTPSTPSNTPPAVRPNPNDRSTNTTPTTGRDAMRNTSSPTLLRELEGVWRVEVSVDEAHWKMGGDRSNTNRSNDTGRTNDSTRSTDGTRDTDPSRTREGDRTNDQNRRENDASNRDGKQGVPGSSSPGQSQDGNRRDGVGNQPGTGNQTGAGNLGKSFVGYAETKLVMGSNILKQSIVIPDMMTGSSTTTQRTDGAAPNQNAIGGDMFRGLSFIGFDESSQEYTIVFMDSRQGKIHCDSGTYDESSRRLVFNGRAGSHTDSGADTNKGMHKGENVRVVLEVMSPTQHRVTMYGGSSMSPNRATPAANTPSTPSTTGSPSATGRNAQQPNQGDRAAMNMENMGNVIYQATYTRAANEDATTFRRMLDEPGSSPSGRMDRTTPTTTPGNRDSTTPGNRQDK